MRKYILITIILLTSAASHAQDTLFFYKGNIKNAYGDNVFLKIAAKDMDTITFNSAQDSLLVYKNGIAFSKTALEDMDSISFHYDYCPDCGIGRFVGIPLLGYGVPADRRVDARAHIDSARAKMRELGYPYDYLNWDQYEIAMHYMDKGRLYVNAVRNGYDQPRGRFYGNGGECYTKGYDYLSDTVVIFISGGPDYAWGYSLQPSQVLYSGVADEKTLEPKDFIPASNAIINRAYNQKHTSILTVPHAGAGLFHPIVADWPRGEICFFDYTTACGNKQKSWPENMLSYQDAELVNAIAIELLRYTVEKLKSMNKTIVYWGVSWGAMTMARYLLYYPIEDFAHVDLFGFQPNMNAGHVSVVREQFGDSNFIVKGKMILGLEGYEMARWRTLPWLTRQDLSRLRMVIGNEDETFGFPSMDVINELTSAGATVVELMGVGHTNFLWFENPYTAESEEITNSWEDDMRIYTKSGIQTIKSKTRKAKAKAVPRKIKTEEPAIPAPWILPMKY